MQCQVQRIVVLFSKVQPNTHHYIYLGLTQYLSLFDEMSIIRVVLVNEIYLCRICEASIIYEGALFWGGCEELHSYSYIVTTSVPNSNVIFKPV